MSESPNRTGPREVEKSATSIPEGSTATADSSAATIEESFEAPADFGRYVFQGEIAHGGMGIVYAARDATFNREVAVKILRGRFAPDSVAARRFLEEAKITGQLQHPVLPPVHDVGALPDGRPFMAMKLIKGRTLGELLTERPDESQDLGQLLAVFEQVCQGVGYAHAHRVIHRDLKPANIMVGSFGEVQVMDWGLAKVLPLPGQTTPDSDPGETIGTEIRSSRDESDVTQAGSLLGTPAYMPPEQAIGAVDRIDCRSDVFSLGGILCQILTGKPPYIGDNAESTRQMAAWGKLDDARSRLRTCHAEPELIALCERCLSPERDDRPEEAGAVAKAVAELRAAADERARRAEVERERARVEAAEQRKRRKLRLTFAAIAAAALVIVATGLSAFAVWRQQKRREALRQVEERQHLAYAALNAHDIDRAIALFGEFDAFAQASGQESFHPTAQQKLHALERFRDFRAKAAAALREGAHNVRDARLSGMPDTVLINCEAALALYGMTEPEFVQRRMNVDLTTLESDEVLRDGHELLVLAAMRLALFDTHDDAGKANTRRALALLDRAASLTLYLPQGYTQTGPTAGELMLRMFWHRRLGENKEADEAGDRMTAMVKADGGFKTARDYYLLGSVTLQIKKKPKEAMNAYRKALKMEPNHYGALWGLYQCAHELGDRHGELAALTALLAVRPNDKDLFFLRGMNYFQGQDYDAAYEDFDAMVQRDPNYALGFFYRGRMQVVKGQWADAEKDFTRAINIGPEAQWLYWRAIARAKVGRYNDAVADADRAAATEPKARLTLFYAARAYSIATGAVAKNDPDRTALVKRYGDRCIELLGRAFDHGFTDRSRLDPGGDFDPVRERADFQELLKRPTQEKTRPNAGAKRTSVPGLMSDRR